MLDIIDEIIEYILFTLLLILGIVITFATIVAIICHVWSLALLLPLGITTLLLGISGIGHKIRGY